MNGNGKDRNNRSDDIYDANSVEGDKNGNLSKSSSKEPKMKQRQVWFLINFINILV